ncbi:hypothetical protein GCM10027418_20240 [Mariniluteicoccus endophyticus]
MTADEPAQPEPAGTAAPADGVVTEQSVGRASVLMASGTMVSRVLGLVRNALLLACIGTAITSDAFNTANTLPNTIYMLLSGGLLNAVLIPQITKALQREDGEDVVDRLLTLCFGAIMVVSVVATALARPLCWALGLRGEALALGTAFAYLCLPQIFFYGAYALLGQVLNARGSYAAFMWTPVLANVVQIAGLAAFLVLFPQRTEPQDWTSPMILLLTGTTTLGIAVQALGLIGPLRSTGFRWRPRWGFRGYGFGSAGRMAGWAFAALVVAQLGGVACTTVFNTVSQRADRQNLVVAGVTIYQLAFLFFMLPHSIITTSILTALYPRMSRAANRADDASLRDLVTRGLTSPSVALVPITALGLVLAVPGIGLMQPSVRGQALHDAALVFSLMLVGLIPFGWTTLQQRFFFAVEDGRTNLVLQGVLTVVQVAFAGIALAGPPAYAVATVAVGQTVGNLAAALAFVAAARSRVGGLPLGTIGGLHLRLIAASVGAGLAAWAAVLLVERSLGATYVAYAVELAGGSAVFAGVFLALARLLRIDELGDLISPVLRRIRRAG